MEKKMQATEIELDTFWGTPTTEAQFDEALSRQTAAFDADDLQTIAAEHALEIMSLMSIDSRAIGRIFTREKAVLILRRVRVELNGATA